MVPPKACPINKLPPELLSRIFELGGTDSHGACQVENGNENVLRDVVGNPPEQTGISSKGLTVDDVADHNGDKRAGEHMDQESLDTSSSFRINVSLVSRHWHSVVISTPSLWTTVTSPGLPHVHPPNTTHLSLLLRRSNSLPIDIDLGGGCQPDVYPLLVPHVHRWRSVKAEFHSHEGMDAFLHAASQPSVSAASQLTTLQLYLQADTEELDIDDSHPLEHFTLFGGLAPCLERLTLWGMHVDWNQAWIISASNLTYLELAFLVGEVCPSWAQFSAILRGAPDLKTLKLYALGPFLQPVNWLVTPDAGTATENPTPPIQLLKLTDFFIGFQSQGHVIVLFSRLYMPSLTSLTLEFRGDDYTSLVRRLAGPPTSLALPSPEETLHSLLSKLENLNIISFPCRQEGIEILYGELQNLKSLHIALHHLWRLSPSFLETLLFPRRLLWPDVWLPLLETVYVSQVSYGYELIRDLVQERKYVGVPLRSLYLEESCGIDLEHLTWFKENVETFGFFEEVHRSID